MSTDCFNKLDPPTQKRYKEMLEIIGNIDPYSAPDSHFSVKIGDFPSICYPDIVIYLVFSPSPFSADDMKAYKSLKAYNQVIEDWVRDVKVMTTSGLKVVKGKVTRLISLNLFVYVFPSYEICLAITNTFRWFFHSPFLLVTHIMSEYFLQGIIFRPF